MNTIDIKSLGAAGDGQTLDSGAVQAAIDKAHSMGGGTVYCPPGTYRCGTMELKSGVALHLEAGCILQASTDRADYRKTMPKEATAHRFNYDEHLIVARNAERIAITGRGVIDGRGPQFLIENDRGRHVVADWRPGQMVSFFECRDVLMRDVRLVDSPSWNIWLLGCERVVIEGISIDTPRYVPNGDGIDVCCSKNVRISDCDIATGDDCIAVYGLPYHLHHLDRCEDVVVTNCTLTGPCCGVRVGYDSDSTIRRCVFSNLTMRTSIGMDILSSQYTEWLTEAERPTERGPRVEDILFQNIIMEGRVLFHMHQGETTQPPAGIRNIRYAHITGTAEHACYFSGSREIPIRDISLQDIRLSVRGEVTEQFKAEAPYPVSVWSSGTKLPHGFYVRYAENVRMRDVRVEWADASGPWRSALCAEEVVGMDLAGLSASQAPGSESPALDLRNVRELSMKSCCALAGTGTFLRLSGDGCGNNRAVGNDLASAAQAFDLADGLESGTLRESGNLL